MNRNIILYIATSLDGYIARSDGAVDWLDDSSSDTNVDNGFDKFYSTIDTVVMGRTTYEQVINGLINFILEDISYKKGYIHTA